jgi:hypothetical protein
MSKTIACDFDGCLVKDKWPHIGEPIPGTIAELKAEQEAGAKTILWTCRSGELLLAAVDWCAEQGIRIDAVNRNLPENIAAYGGDSMKVYADEYWDDRARLMPPGKAGHERRTKTA